MKFFTRREERYKDGKWYQGGWLAYHEDYNKLPVKDHGALFFVRSGNTEQEAIDALQATWGAYERGVLLSDGYWLIKHGLVPQYVVE